MRHVPARLAIGVAAAMTGSAANAVLGGATASVEADRAHLSARMSSAAAATHTTHTLTDANGGIVREYARADGTVFAVSWRGPARPDLRQLLGDRFDAFRVASSGHRGRTRRPIAMRQGDLVVRSAGHPGAFFGVAYLAALVPAGFTAADLR